MDSGAKEIKAKEIIHRNVPSGKEENKAEDDDFIP